jgi:hypothetical protein
MAQYLLIIMVAIVLSVGLHFSYGSEIGIFSRIDTSVYYTLLTFIGDFYMYKALVANNSYATLIVALVMQFAFIFIHLNYLRATIFKIYAKGKGKDICSACDSFKYTHNYLNPHWIVKKFKDFWGRICDRKHWKAKERRRVQESSLREIKIQSGLYNDFDKRIDAPEYTNYQKFWRKFIPHQIRVWLKFAKVLYFCGFLIMLTMLRVTLEVIVEESMVDYVSQKIIGNLGYRPTVLSSEWDLRKYFIDTLSPLMGSGDCTADKLSKDSSIDNNQKINSNFVFKAEYKEIIPTPTDMFKQYAGYEMAPGQANYWPAGEIYNREYDFQIRDFNKLGYWSFIAGTTRGTSSNESNTDYDYSEVAYYINWNASE